MFFDIKFINADLIYHSCFFAQLAGWVAVEYTNCTSAEGYDPPPNKCPAYDTG